MRERYEKTASDGSVRVFEWSGEVGRVVKGGWFLPARNFYPTQWPFEAASRSERPLLVEIVSEARDVS